MAVFNSTLICSGVGEVWSQAVADWQTWIANSGSSFGMTLTTASGYRAILLSSTYGGNTYNITYVATDIPAASTASLRHIAQSPGWRRRPTFQNAIAGTGSTAVTTWRSVMVAKRREIWQTWGGAAVVAAVSSTFLCEAGQYSAYFDHFTAHKAYEALVDALILYGWNTGVSIGFQGSVGPCDGLDTYPAPVAINLLGVEAGLADLNNSRLDVSINNGAVVVSAVGGTNIT